MSILTFCHWLESTTIALAIRGSPWPFAILQTIHALGIILMAGTIFVVDLRLLGFGLRREPVSSVLQQLLPWTWAGVLLMFLTGVLLFMSEAVKCYTTLSFRIKLVLLLMAGANALAFHWGIYRKVREWELDPIFPSRARLAGLVSITLWVSIIAAGRAIAYEADAVAPFL